MVNWHVFKVFDYSMCAQIGLIRFFLIQFAISIPNKIEFESTAKLVKQYTSLTSLKLYFITETNYFYLTKLIVVLTLTFLSLPI